MKPTIETGKGHWILSQTGKRVLRPGGRELTLQILEHLHISPVDEVVEFAPGTGFTATQVLKYHPRSYTGIELDEVAAAILRKKIKTYGYEVLVRNAAHTDLRNDFASKVYGEAMLTMQADHRKSEIMNEACRILKKGGLYAIHELSLIPDDISNSEKKTIQKRLAQLSKVNARPLTASEWTTLIERSGFRVRKVLYSPMKLLEMKRILRDEGFFHTLQIGFNVMRQAGIRQRVMEMRKVFKNYKDHLQGIAIIAEKTV